MADRDWLLVASKRPRLPMSDEERKRRNNEKRRAYMQTQAGKEARRRWRRKYEQRPEVREAERQRKRRHRIEHPEKNRAHNRRRLEILLAKKMRGGYLAPNTDAPEVPAAVKAARAAHAAAMGAADLMLLVERAMPRYATASERDDVVSEAIVGILSGEVSLDELDQHMARIVKRVRGEFGTFGYQPLEDWQHARVTEGVWEHD